MTFRRHESARFSMTIAKRLRIGDLIDPSTAANWISDREIGKQAAWNQIGSSSRWPQPSFVRLIQSGCDVVDRHIESVRVMSVKDFGAVGDGNAHPLSERFTSLAAAQNVYPFVTSLSQSVDWAAIQAAIKTLEAQPQRGVLRIPAGKYIISDTILVTKAIKIRGDGEASSIITATQSIDAIFANLASSNDHGLHIIDLTITNSLPIGSQTSGSGIRLNGVYRATIRNVKVLGCYNGVRATNSGLSVVSNLHVIVFNHAGLLFDGEIFDIYVSDFIISGTGQYGIKLLERCDESIFERGIISTVTTALYTDAAVLSVNQCPGFCRFSKISFDTCDNGIDLANCTDFVFDGSFVSCRPNHGAQVGVRGPTRNVSFSNTHFFWNGKSALVVGMQSAGTRALGCRFLSSSQTSSNTYDSVSIAAGFGSWDISHCTFDVEPGYATNPRYHINIASTGTADYRFANNRFGNAGTKNVNDLRQGADRQCHGNHGFRTRNAFAAIFLSGSTAGQAAHGLAETPNANFGVSFRINGYPPIVGSAQVRIRVLNTDANLIYFESDVPVPADTTLLGVASLIGDY